MISETLYARYIGEREGSQIIENENGFITYKINGEECFLVDMYVRMEVRRSGEGRKLLNELIKIAKGHECKFISANIYTVDHGATNTLKAALISGFELLSAKNECVTILLNLREVNHGE